jgi:hypothetical protein
MAGGHLPLKSGDGLGILNKLRRILRDLRGVLRGQNTPRQRRRQG